MSSDKERWLVRVNLVGVHKPVRLRPCTSHFTGKLGWQSKCGDYDYYGKPANKHGCRDYVFKDRGQAQTFHKGAMAVFTALRDFMGD